MYLYGRDYQINLNYMHKIFFVTKQWFQAFLF